MKLELTIPIILVVTITVKQPAASAQAPRWHLYSLLDVEFGACLIPCSTTSCASIATIKGGVDAAVDLYSCWTAKAWQMATSRLHDESAKNKDAPPSHPLDCREFFRHSIWFDYPPPVRAKPHVKPSSSVAPSSVVPPKPSVAPNLKQPSRNRPLRPKKMEKTSNPSAQKYSNLTRPKIPKGIAVWNGKEIPLFQENCGEILFFSYLARQIYPLGNQHIPTLGKRQSSSRGGLEWDIV